MAQKFFEVMVTLRYVSNFWITLEIVSNNCEITLQLTCSKKRIQVAGTAASQIWKFKITGTKLYITDEYQSIETHSIVLYVNAKNVTYLDSFVYIPKEIKESTVNKNVITNIYRMQAYDSIMCRYFCIGFIDFMLKDESLFDYTTLFFPNDYEKNDKIILKYFQ